VGFIDVGIEPYRLCVYLPTGTSAVGVTGLKEAMDVALVDTNVRLEPVPPGADANHPALQIARTHGIDRFPAAVLVSPDGQSMPVPLVEAPSGGIVKAEGPGEGSIAREEDHRQAAFDDATQTTTQLTRALDGLLSSVTRRQILEKCANAYGVVLLIEGPESKANATAREIVSASLSQIGAQMEFLPKPIKKPPEVVVLDHQSLAREHVLLWTFRLKPADVNQPHAAVFYGRGRWLGPLMAGETLTADNLMQILSIIGGDCECGLDHRWLQGTMLPLRWDPTLQQKAVESLGFDPENPMIKMEMVSIVRRGMGGFDYPGAPLDYREIEVGGDVEETIPKIEVVEKELPPWRPGPPGALAEPPAGGPVIPLPGPSGAMTEPPVGRPITPDVAQEARPALVGQVLAVSLGGMAALVGVASVVILWRARKS
jgi:hypothetical protein